MVETLAPSNLCVVSGHAVDSASSWLFSQPITPEIPHVVIIVLVF